MLFDTKWDKSIEAPVELESWRGALLKAADIIRRRGWCQHQASSHGRVCLLGALSVATGGKPSTMKGDIFCEAERKLCDNGFHPAWNDNVGRTKAEVISALEETAKA